MEVKLLRFLKKLKTLSKSKFSQYPDNFAKLLEEKLKKLEKLVGYKIKDPTFYIKALTHRSFSEFTDYHLRSNERLEFLGDSVISLVIAEYLFKAFPNEAEGFLTKTRAKLVNRAALAKAVEKINLLDCMLFSNSFLVVSNGINTIISNALEALVGAIYIDTGLESARKFIERVIINPVIAEGVFLVDKNFKSQLLEFTQAHKLDNPVYKLAKEEGPHHSKTFTIEVYVEGLCYGLGVGKNKKEAEQNAAQDALVKIGETKKAPQPS